MGPGALVEPEGGGAPLGGLPQERVVHSLGGQKFAPGAEDGGFGGGARKQRGRQNCGEQRSEARHGRG